MHATTVSLLSLLLLALAPAGWLGVYLDAERQEAVVAEVIPDSPAARAGLEPGDVLLAVEDQATPTRDEFVAAIRASRANTPIRLKLRRGAEERTVTVRLADRPAAEASPPATATRPAAPAQPPAPLAERGAAGKPGYLGVVVDEAERGVVVSRVFPGSPAAAAGVAVGDAIATIDATAVQDLDDLDRALAGLAPGSRVALGLRSAHGSRSVVVTLGHRDGPPVAPPAPIVSAPLRPAAPPSAAAPAPAPRRTAADIDSEVAALRAELAELRRQLEALRAELRAQRRE
jgi:S1-C subfamily serine protease